MNRRTCTRPVFLGSLVLGFVCALGTASAAASPIGVSTQGLIRAAMCLSAASPRAVLVSGAAFGFSAPRPSYPEGELSLQITLGYGDPSTTVGDLLWHQEPGSYSLAVDPDFERFAALTENGTRDPLRVTVRDIEGYEVAYDFASLQEVLWGTYPDVDFGPNRVLDMTLNVLFVGPFESPNVGIAINLETLCTPEPSAAVGAVLGALYCVRRPRPHVAEKA